jgi:hypothetical protein
VSEEAHVRCCTCGGPICIVAERQKPDDLREVKNLPCYTTSYTATCLYTSGDHIA